MQYLKAVLLLLAVALLSACSSPVPKQQRNVCAIFKAFPRWYWITQAVQAKWHVPISVQMAIMHEESHFVDNAKPAREHLLGFIPWTHSTTAVGYAQATNETWRGYLQARHLRSASRDSFSNTANFIGWYVDRLHHQLGIRRNNAYAIYLAYHEGMQGYREGSYRHKPTLIHIARHVQAYTARYHGQLIHCKHQLPQKPWWWV